MCGCMCGCGCGCVCVGVGVGVHVGVCGCVCMCVLIYVEAVCYRCLQRAFHNGEWGKMSARDRGKIMYRWVGMAVTIT